MSDPPEPRNKVLHLLRASGKSVFQGLSLLFAFPAALLTGFGRFSAAFQGFGHLMALMPGLPGDYLRVAYYVLTLRKCSLQSRISFGSFFAQSASEVGTGVYIGAFCVLGVCTIGERSQIASHVQIPGGRHAHSRDENGRISGANEKTFESISIGADCWIGASAIIMADIGAGTTVGAGAVVTRPLPPGVVAVGNPARLLERVLA